MITFMGPDIITRTKVPEHILQFIFRGGDQMTFTYKNRKDINREELVTLVHDACFESFTTAYENGKYCYELRANIRGEWEEKYVFHFEGVSSCLYTGENHSYILGGAINCWYSLPGSSYNGLDWDSLTGDEMREWEQHGTWKINNIRRNIRLWEHEYSALPESTEKSFKVVFFLSTPAFLEVECEELLFEKIKCDRA